MPACSRCGGSIEFRYIDGRCVPLHVAGGGWSCGGYDGSRIVDYAGYSRSDESCCFLTTCPECGDKVYFVRYNGGSVWINPPLGWPWYKHSCMDRPNSSPSSGRSALVSNSSLIASRQGKGLIIGIVKEAETSASKRCTVINLETGKDQNVVLLLKNNAGFLVGRLVVYDQKSRIVLWLENNSYAFRVVAPIKAASEGQAPIECPECHTVVSVSSLSDHLKVTHRIPRKPFAAS
jgi:hypothetical protein